MNEQTNHKPQNCLPSVVYQKVPLLQNMHHQTQTKTRPVLKHEETNSASSDELLLLYQQHLTRIHMYVCKVHSNPHLQNPYACEEQIQDFICRSSLFSIATVNVKSKTCYKFKICCLYIWTQMKSCQHASSTLKKVNQPCCLFKGHPVKKPGLPFEPVLFSLSKSKKTLPIKNK